jgi:hypothetical protein
LLQAVEELVDHLMEQVVLNLMVEEEQEKQQLELTGMLLQIQVQVVEHMLHQLEVLPVVEELVVS